MTLQEIGEKLLGVSAKIDALTTKNTQAEADLTTAKASLASAETITKDLQGQIVTLTATLAERDARLKEMTDANTNLQAVIKETKASVAAEAAKIAAANMAAIGAQPPVADNTKTTPTKADKQEKEAFGMDRFLNSAADEIQKLYPKNTR